MNVSRLTTTLVIGALALSTTACGPSDPAASADPGPAETVDAASADPGPAETVDAASADPGPAEAVDAASADADVFDAGVVHEITLEFDQADYDEMIGAYQETGEKEWIEATVTIDGHTFERVGLRLKGNSSLAGLGGPGLGGGGRPDAGDAESVDRDEAQRPGGGPAGFGGASAETPEELPWLIRLDKFVDDQTYQGYEDFVVRSNNSETALNEAVSLALLADAGLASQDAIATRFSVNGSDDVLRLVVEHPDDDKWYETRFDGDGALYKAESTGDWSYRGDDPASYEEVFDQEGGSDVADLTPLIEFLRFINDSDDATFAAELPDRLDVDAFATYLAMMDLIGNSDDIDGPGNNAYLWWDAGTEQFTVVPWDMNLALGGGLGGPGGPGGGGFGGALPEDFDPPGGPPSDGQDPGRGGFPGGGGPGGGSNPLVERFLANAEFNALYEQRLDELTTEMIASGSAGATLDQWVEVLTTEAGDLIAADVVESEAATIRDLLTE